MNEIIKRTESTELSADYLTSLASGLANSVAAMPASGGGGKPILRLLKSGSWVFGQTDDPVQRGSEWAVNPATIMHGWVCWNQDPNSTKGKLLGETMVPATQAFPVQPPPIDGSVWKAQRNFELTCTSGEDEGVLVLYKGSSDGAREACNNFFALLGRHYAGHSRDNPCPYPVPIIQLGVTDYKHPKHGQTFKPIFELIDWAAADGSRESDGHEAAPIEFVQASAAAPTGPAKVKPPLETARPGGAPRRQRPVDRA